MVFGDSGGSRLSCCGCMETGSFMNGRVWVVVFGEDDRSLGSVTSCILAFLKLSFGRPSQHTSQVPGCAASSSLRPSSFLKRKFVH
ncbi:hypothetical protein HanRHA438_Chr17g0831591 [Helianthus annuus]|nr:hypothetical protein HanIR_Chr17g0891951 [Helianthus annuus]KAJ0827942.1 hypothetical protein HanRHA438_Chr17g0831591 [Helianthus annuus]